MAQTTIRKGPDPIRKKQKQLPFPLNIYQSAVGKKWAMAVSGVVLLGFVVTHMIGNLHLYEGPLEIHEYAETLRNLGTDIIPRTKHSKGTKQWPPTDCMSGREHLF